MTEKIVWHSFSQTLNTHWETLEIDLSRKEYHFKKMVACIWWSSIPTKSHHLSLHIFQALVGRRIH